MTRENTTNNNSLQTAFKEYLKCYDYNKHYTLKRIREKFSDDQFDVLITYMTDKFIETLEDPNTEAVKDLLTEAISFLGYPNE